MAEPGSPPIPEPLSKVPGIQEAAERFIENCDSIGKPRTKPQMRLIYQCLRNDLANAVALLDHATRRGCYDVKNVHRMLAEQKAEADRTVGKPAAREPPKPFPTRGEAQGNFILKTLAGVAERAERERDSKQPAIAG
jgi:hypothetical protein